jgi:hypothetical protein
MTSREKYAAFFGRAADVVLDANPDDPQSPSVYRFPPTRAGFLKRIFTPLASDFVFMTDGMSRHAMSVPPEEQRVYPSRIELFACTKGAPVVGPESRDVITAILQGLAVAPFTQGVFFGPLHTFDLGEPISSNSEMTGFLFAVPEGVDIARLCSCTPAAELVVSVIPVTASEIRYGKAKGPDQLIAQFEKAGVKPIFDPFRKGVDLPGP